MKAILDVRREGDERLLVAQPGLLLAELDEALRSSDPGFCLAPDPTERSCSIGGMTSTNASGSRSFRCGPMRRYVRGIRVVLADGSAVVLRRGGARARGRAFRLVTGGDRAVDGRLPGYRMPEVKNAAGYFARDDMDLLDLFVGSEGTLGVVTEVEVALSREPALTWGIMVFLPDDDRLVRFVDGMRAAAGGGDAAVAGIEYFDRGALAFLEASRRVTEAFSGLPSIRAGAGPAAYVELHAGSDAAAEAGVERLSAVLGQCGGNDGDTWFASSPAEVARLKAFRHALPEAVNMAIDERRRVDPSLAKLGTDMASPAGRLGEVLAMYERDLAAAGLPHVKFGHIGDSHVHVNIIPESRAQYEAGRKLYRQWAGAVVAMGGTISAEHGVGKLKRELLEVMYGPAAIQEMRDLKRSFDPGFILGRGTMFTP